MLLVPTKNIFLFFFRLQLTIYIYIYIFIYQKKIKSKYFLLKKRLEMISISNVLSRKMRFLYKKITFIYNLSTNFKEQQWNTTTDDFIVYSRLIVGPENSRSLNHGANWWVHGAGCMYTNWVALSRAGRDGDKPRAVLCNALSPQHNSILPPHCYRTFFALSKSSISRVSVSLIPS